MADDRTRLLGSGNGKSKASKAKEGQGSIPGERDRSGGNYLYGTWNESAGSRNGPETSSAAPSVLQRQSTFHQHLESPSQGSVTTSVLLSSPTSTSSSDGVPTNSNYNIQPDSSKNKTFPYHNLPLLSEPDTAVEFEPNPHSLKSTSNDNSNHSRHDAVTRQPAEPLQSDGQVTTTQTSPTFTNKNKYQETNQSDTEELDISLGISDFINKSSSSPPRHPHNLENLISQSRNKGNKLRLDTDQSKSESDRLFNSPNMEFSGHLNGGKKAPNDKDSEKTKSDEKAPFFVYYLACFATIGGLLFGYDTGIVSGSMLLIKDYFALNTIWQEVIVSGTVAAAAIFSLFAGFMCDFFGRKVTIMVASVVFVGGAIIMGASNSTGMLLAGRIVVGIGIGFASMTVPVYVAEAAPSSIRGRLVTLNQLFITIGILISSVIAGAFSTMKEDGWRYMLGLAGVPGLIQFVGFLFLPESPRWLMTKGREEEAEKVLRRIRGKDDVMDEIKEIREAVEEDKKQQGFVLGRVVRTQHVRRALFVGSGLQVFQQLCGINTVIYYSATILKMAGFPSESAIWLVLVPNGINFLSTFIGVALVERLGRKKLIVISFLGVVIALVVLAVGFQLSANFSPSIDKNVTEYNLNGTILQDGCFDKYYGNCEECIEDTDCGFCFSGDGDRGSCLRILPSDEDTLSTYGRCRNETLKSHQGLKFSHGFCPTDFTWMAVLGLALFVMAFAPGLGPMPWTINSEIYPMWARSTCTSIATGANWICNLIVSLFFLTLTETITKYGAFWLFGGICFIGMLFTITFLPETKNKSLEEVEELFKNKKSRGADNLGYEREIPPPTANNNTRL